MKTLKIAFGLWVAVATMALAGSAASIDGKEKPQQYAAKCTDGHGMLTAWKNTYDEANAAGKAHELATHGHRWTVLTRDKP